MELLQEILTLCVFPLLGVLTAYAIKWLRAHELEILDRVDNDTADKYIALLFETISDCVSATTQTYVDELKKKGEFTAEAQKEAFQKTFDAVMQVLNDDAKDYLATIYGDLTAFIATKIEAEVRAQK